MSPASEHTPKHTAAPVRPPNTHLQNDGNMIGDEEEVAEKYEEEKKEKKKEEEENLLICNDNDSL